MQLSFATLILCLACFISACSTPLKDNLPTEGIKATNWSSDVRPGSGYLHISGTLAPGATTLIQFGKDKHDITQLPLIIHLSDEDCNLGYRARIRYHADKRNILHEYSESEIPWNTPYELEAQWDNGELRITLNGELRQIKKFQPFKYVNISSSQPVRIKNSHALAKSKLTGNQ